MVETYEDRRRRRKEETLEALASSKTDWWPWVLLAAGLGMCFGTAFAIAGGIGVAVAVIWIGIYLTANIPINIAAFYVVAWLMNTGFGTLGGAILRLAAFLLFIQGGALLILAFGPVLGDVGLIMSLLVLIIVSWCLFLILFDLNLFEVLVCGLVITFIQFLVTYLFSLVSTFFEELVPLI